jgi:PAS domain S-box-containing protein
MKNKSVKDVLSSNRVLLVGIGIAILIWTIDVLVDVFLFQEGDVKQQIFSPEPFEIYFRSLLWAVVLAFSIYAQSVVTERKKAEEALRESEEKYRVLVDGALVGVYMSSLEGDVLFVNDTLSKKLGYESPDELLSVKAPELYKNPGDRDRLIKNLKRYGEANNFEVEMLTKTGETRGMLLNSKLSGDIISGIIDDITERKQIEEAVIDLNEQLDQSNQLKGLFTDVLRHDLLNPTGVIGNIAEIMEYDEKLKGAEEIEVIKRNVKKLEDIIQNASQYAMLESKEALEKSELKLTELIENVIDDLRPYAGGKKMKVEFNPDREHKLNASGAIESVFVNILSNAIKYSPEGTDIKITIDDDGKNKKIQVADQGDGILDENKKAVFDRFTRKDKRGVKGTGLGLAITKKIVELHNGRVWVEDNPEGKGTVFIVEIPK